MKEKIKKLKNQTPRTELRVSMGEYHTIEGAEKTIKAIKEIAKENNCDCTLIEIHVARKLTKN